MLKKPLIWGRSKIRGKDDDLTTVRWKFRLVIQDRGLVESILLLEH